MTARERVARAWHDGSGRICEGCDYGAMNPPEWPCPTVRAVTAALGGEQ